MIAAGGIPWGDLFPPFAVVLAAAIGSVATITTALIAAGVIGRRVDKVEQQQAQTKAATEFVVSEVSPNHGSSLKDQVTRLEARAIDRDGKLEVLTLASASHDGRLAKVEGDVAATRAGVHLLLKAAGIDPDELAAAT